MKGEGAALLALASSVADGEVVDWAQAVGGARDSSERALIDRLRIIATIGQVHRTADELERPEPAAKVVGRIRPTSSFGESPESRSSQAGHTPAPTERWGQLTLLERVGTGVYGEVYRAFDESLRRDVAVKLLRTGSRSADLLASKILHEGRLLARVHHRNVVTVHGVETHGDRVGLWMEFIRGCTLEQLLERQGPFGGREAALVGQDLCRALAAVHGAGLVHRDVKAQNVIREEGGRVVLMDFGTGLLLDDEEEVRNSAIAGTPMYLAPEVLAGLDPSPTSDLYGLGVLLFHLVTGTYPYAARTLLELRDAHQSARRRRLHDLRPDLPEGFVHVVERALEPSPQSRYQSAGALQRGLTHALGLESGLMSAYSPPAPAPQPVVGAAKPAAVSRPIPLARWQVWVPLVAAVLVAVAVIAWLLRTTPASATAPMSSVVVLPFANLSGSDRDLSHGIELLISDRLSSLSSARMVEYTDAMARRDRGLAVEDVIRRHDVEGAINGSVTWSGGTARVSVQIVRAGVRVPVWTREFERPVARAAELPRDVARELARALAVQLSPAEEARLSAADAAAPGVFEAYLRGRGLLRRPSSESVERAIEQFLTALQIDPNHAPSLAWLAECYFLQGVTYRTRPLGEAAALARQAAQRALTFDDSLATAQAIDAQLKFLVDWDVEGADRAFARAIELSPNSSELRENYAMFLASRRRLPDALQQMQKAVSLDPTSLQAQSALGMIWHYARSNDQAERVFREVLAVDAGLVSARMGLVRVLLAVGRYDEALKQLVDLQSSSSGRLSPAHQAAFAVAYAGIGRKDDARRIAEDLVINDSADGPSVDAASVFVAIGDADRALDILERAVDARAPKAQFLRLDPRFDALTGHPRFVKLVERLSLAS
jgi:serine/threonine protein kinase/Tfp pilus assembly protein PilF